VEDCLKEASIIYRSLSVTEVPKFGFEYKVTLYIKIPKCMSYTKITGAERFTEPSSWKT
jgi:hypothetical protein